MRKHCFLGKNVFVMANTELSNSLTDEELCKLVERCDVPTLQSLLRKGSIPYANVRKPALQIRLYYAVKLGLPVVKNEEERDVERNQQRSSKLQIGPGMSVPHPLMLADGWESLDLPHANFPDFTCDDIKNYFEACNLKQGLNTGGQKALKEGRSISLSDGRVCDVKYNPINAIVGVGFISGLVVPQTRINDKPYMVWVLMFKNTGVVHNGDCHCIAGLSGICKHIAALLYKTADAVKHGQNSACTSSLQTWHQPSKKLKSSSFMEDIKTPKASSSMTKHVRPRRDQFDPRAPGARKKRSLADYDLDTLSDITNGKAAVLLYASNFREEQLLSQKPDMNLIGEMIEVESSSTISNCTVSSAHRKSHDFDSFIQELSITSDSQEYLVSSTKEQSSSPVWKEHRKGRLTASNMGQIMFHVDSHGNITGSTHSITATIMSYYKTMDQGMEPQSIRWGKSREKKALRLFEDQEKPKHTSWAAETTGLWVSLSHPFIAASPDSLVTCDCCAVGVVEVKNPWNCRNLTIKEFAVHPQSFLELSDGDPALKKSHRYYAQVQCQMFCTGRSYCDFVTLMNADTDFLCVSRVLSDPEFIQDMLFKAKIFMEKVILPELQGRNVQQKVAAKYLT